MPIPITACRDDRPVRFQSDRVLIACRDGHDIRPVAHIALPRTIPACRDDRPVRFQSDRVSFACRDFSFMQIPIANLIAALERILIPNSRCKHLCRSLTVLFHKQSFALLVLQLFSLRCRVAVISSRLICRYRSVVVTRRKHRFALLVLCFFGFGCRVAVISSRLIRRYRAVVVVSRQQAFSFLVLQLFDLCCRVAVISSRLECRNGFVILPVLHHLDRSIIPIAQKNSPRRNRNRRNRHNRNYRNDFVSFSSGLFGCLIIQPFLSKPFTFIRLFPAVLVITQSLKVMLDFSIIELRFCAAHSVATILIFDFKLLIPLLKLLIPLLNRALLHFRRFCVRLVKRLRQLLLRLADILRLLRLSVLQPLVQFGVQRRHRRIIPRLYLALRKLHRTDKILTLALLPHPIQILFCIVHIGSIRLFFRIKLRNFNAVQIPLNRVLLHRHRDMLLLFIRYVERQRNRLKGLLCKCFRPAFHAVLLFSCQELAHIRFGVLCVAVQHAVKKLIGFFPVAVGERHIAALEQRRRVGFAADRNILLHHLLNNLRHIDARALRLALLLFAADDLFNAAQQILHRADLAHILRLKPRKLLGHVICVDILVAGNQRLFLPRRNQRKITAPFVLDPDGVVIFVIRADGEHDLRAVERREDIWLIFLTEFILQRNACKKYAVALFGQRVIDILCQNAVKRAASVFVGFLVADKDVVRLLFAGDLDNPLAQLLDLLRLVAVDLTRHSVGVFARLIKVVILHHAVKRRAMAGRDFFARLGVIHILDAIFAQHKPPIGFRLGRELRDDAFVNARRFIKLAAETQAVCPRKKRHLLLVIRGRDGLPAAAVFALHHVALGYIRQIAAAHLALENRHLYILRIPKCYQ